MGKFNNLLIEADNLIKGRLPHEVTSIIAGLLLERETKYAKLKGAIVIERSLLHEKDADGNLALDKFMSIIEQIENQ